MTNIIQNCIEWNKARALQAKTRTDRLRYEENIKNLQSLQEANSGN